MNNGEYKIEKNVPIPGYPSKGRWKELANKMEVGDSVVVHNRNEIMNLRNALVKLGYHAVCRGTDTDHPRVWKTEKKQQ